jgi:uncharacterized protein YkwD
MRVWGIAAALAALIFGLAAQACELRLPAGAQDRVVQAGDIDGGLLNAAVLAEVNYARCRGGRGELSSAGAALIRIAAAHSRWMIRAGDLTHRSNVAGRQTAAERIRAAGLRVRHGAENVGLVSYYQIDGAPFRIRGDCAFESHAGQPLPPHTYASLARQIVAAAMGSAEHRRNLLDRRVGRTAIGVAFDRHGPYCGRIWFTQDFVN